MSSAVDALDAAAVRLDETVERARLAAGALEGVSGPLTDRVAELVSRADDARLTVVRARDALIDAGA